MHYIARKTIIIELLWNIEIINFHICHVFFSRLSQKIMGRNQLMNLKILFLCAVCMFIQCTVGEIESLVQPASKSSGHYCPAKNKNITGKHMIIVTMAIFIHNQTTINY